MQIITLLNQCYRFPGFVYNQARLSEDRKRLEIRVRPRVGSKAQVINNEKCTSPSTISEDYHGAECTGTVIASLDNPMVATGASGGEGFYGFVPVVTPDRDKATIALDLTLRKVPAPFIASRSKLTEK
jgi:hypothetical protein